MPKKKENNYIYAKYKDILGIFLIAFSVLLLLSFILGGDKRYVGAIGSMLAAGLTNFLGLMSYLLPLVLIWWAVTEFRNKKFYFKYSMTAGMLIFILGGSILLHVISPSSGGILGDFSSDVIIQITFGRLGAYIISIALILMSLILMADISISRSITFILTLMKRLYGKFPKKIIGRKPVKQDPPVTKQPKPAKVKKETATKMVKTIFQKKQRPKKEKEKPAVPDKITPPVPAKASISSSKQYEVPLNLLTHNAQVKQKTAQEYERGEKLVEVLANFDIGAEIAAMQVGPAITRYEVTLPPDIKLSRIRNLDSNIAMALEAKTVRLLTPIPGKAAVGVEVPAIQQETVSMKTLIESDNFRLTDSSLPYCLGKSVNGDLEISDLAEMPHLLLAGATGSGKSVAIHVLINSIIFKSSPDDVRFILIDPKRVELPVYNGIPHLDSDVITDTNKAVRMLQAITSEMDQRYEILSQNNVANITAYNVKIAGGELKRLPRIVVIIDELADLMVMAKDKVERAIVRIAQMARAVGIHLVLATQRPSVDIITGIIKANLPARIAFNVLSGVDSRTILDSNGAEKLLGKGDMLYLASDLPQPERLQGCLIKRKEVENIVKYLKTLDFKHDRKLSLEDKLTESAAGIEYEDQIYPEAVKLVIEKKTASISFLQRRLRIGYNRAARIIDKMEDNGIVSEINGAKGREVLVSEDYLSELPS